MDQPYEPPEPTGDATVSGGATAAVPGRTALWLIAAISFCFGAASLVGAWVFWWHAPELLAGLSGLTYFYYLLRPFALAVGFLGLSWKCLRYIDAITHNSIDSTYVGDTHGRLWNWIAAMLVGFVVLVVYHSLGG